jgi:hypothetical protein
MKRLAGLQIVLGILAAIDCGILASLRKYSPSLDQNGFVHTIPQPNFIFDVFLVCCGVLIFGIALLLRTKKGRLATLQVILGQDIAIISFILYRMALDNYEYIQPLYWVIFPVMASAVLVTVTGLIQIFSKTQNQT